VLDTVTEGVLLSQKMKLEERLAAETAAPAVPAGER
jgi:hypothetical protein